MGRHKGNRVYTAKNIITGEVVTGNSREIAEKINLPIKSLFTYTDRGSVYKKTWVFSFVDENVVEEVNDDITCELLDEWDKERIRVREILKNRGKSKRRIRK